MNYRDFLPFALIALCACETAKSDPAKSADSTGHHADHHAADHHADHHATTQPANRPTSQPMSQPTSQPSKPVGALMDATGYEKFGAPVTAGLTVPVATALAAPEAYADKSVRLVGTVQSVCKKKGCWMRVGEGEEQLFVRFKDYGFFVPLDCEGSEVVFEGEMQVSMVSVEDQKHYLEDAGKTDEAAKVTEPKRQVMFMATGVAMKR